MEFEIYILQVRLTEMFLSLNKVQVLLFDKLVKSVEDQIEASLLKLDIML